MGSELILLVEDDESVRKELAVLLERNGYSAASVEQFVDIAGQVERLKPDLVLLDVNLPEIDGFTICTQIRCFSNVPVIFLTGRSSEMDELSGITFGGDDFITKPFNSVILLARINRVLSRVPKDKQPITVSHKEVTFNPLSGELTYKNSSVELTKTESKIIYYLFTNSSEIALRDKLAEYLWDNGIFIDDNALSVNMTRIREKLNTMGLHDFIVTKRGRGYMV